jgi:2-aminomuconate deaminase
MLKNSEHVGGSAHHSTPSLFFLNLTIFYSLIVCSPVLLYFAKMSDIILTDKASSPLGGYPHARRVGNFLFLSGIGPRSPKDNSIPGLELDAQGNIVNYDIEAECHSVFANVKAVLEASGSSWDRIVDVTVFLTNMKKDFQKYNKIYGEYFKNVQACRTTIEVKSLPTPISIELKVIATCT